MFSAVSCYFLFDCIRHFAFSDGVAEAEIVLGDQAAGLIAAMPIPMLNCKLQHYNWHVSQTSREDSQKRSTLQRNVTHHESHLVVYSERQRDRFGGKW